MMANRNETLAEATRLYETVTSFIETLLMLQADQVFNTLDHSITVSEENLLNPPSTSYFLPSPPPENEEDTHLSDVSSSEDGEDDADDDQASVKTDQLTPAHLYEVELKALRRRMKKSFQWLPTPACIKKELQMNGRWPLHSVDKAARHKEKLAKIKRKRERQLRKLQKERSAAARKAAQARIAERKKNQKLKDVKKQDPKVQYTMPVAADEPTYCYCRDVSYGEMIACENEVSLINLSMLMIVLSARVVSLGMCWFDCGTEGEMVLSRL